VTNDNGYAKAKTSLFVAYMFTKEYKSSNSDVVRKFELIRAMGFTQNNELSGTWRDPHTMCRTSWSTLDADHASIIFEHDMNAGVFIKVGANDKKVLKNIYESLCAAGVIKRPKQRQK